MFGNRLKKLRKQYKKLITRKNIANTEYNGIFIRYKNPVLTAQHIPIEWRYDLNPACNPNLLERLAVNSVFNAGAIYYDNKFVLVARVEGADRKSFFAKAVSLNATDNFEFVEPILFPKIGDETNLYDMRLTLHQDGYIYGVFCSESLSENSDEAIAQAGIVRTHDLKNWERLPNLKTKSPQQRNCVLHPEYVNGQYMFYTRPQDGFIEVGNSGGICGGLCQDITNAFIEKEILIAPRRYHTVYETKNGAGIVPIKTDRGWIHIAHGVRNTACGLRYVLYAFATDLTNPFKIIAKPSGYLMAPQNDERIGDVSNVLFCNGAIEHNGIIYLYYASSDTQVHVASLAKDVLIDYIFNTPKEEFNTYDCTAQRIKLINQNKQLF